MQALVVVKPVSVAGEIAYPGVHVLTDENVESLIEAGYLRKLTHEENEIILDAYVEEAERVFSECTISEVRPKSKAHVQENLI
jgi:hypothetical protein